MASDYSGWLWLAVDVILVLLLAAAIVYGTMMWRRRYRDRTTERVRDEATDRLYRKE